MCFSFEAGPKFVSACFAVRCQLGGHASRCSASGASQLASAALFAVDRVPSLMAPAENVEEPYLKPSNEPWWKTPAEGYLAGSSFPQ